MHIQGIDEITFGASDLATCRRFFTDWGLTLLDETQQQLVFETLNGCRVRVAHGDTPGLPPGVEPDPTLREVVWAVGSAAELDACRERLRGQPGYVDDGQRVGCTDPNGLAVRVQVTRKRPVQLECARTNTWSERPRVNRPAPAYERAQPVEVGHVVFFVLDLAATTAFYERCLGFVVSDRYPGRGHFMRCAPEGGHHDLFLLVPPIPRKGLNHVAFTVRDLHEVIGGGMHMSRCGWTTELGPGRHPISSALFWYFENPAGALVEYYTDEDELTADWTPRDFTPGPTVFAEWAIKGGIDGHTRRQVNAEAPSGRFMTDKPKA
ncbi:VOC family protein [Calidifontimicrobium sp. SYSU G02091]|uniref:VOC family protein n=1 Tax=Calidifontimicrobium sp. SYSU G02091 TaxID=2926421 RepID=UPI001F5369DA|nr:VOC family protein [Calidifontimicrobium sp. SYSU G02091]MCI1193246.1 VOC family protein [Calidifontimicrobium sp. SYSU G02091]